GNPKSLGILVCMPKHEGDLGIRRINDFNVALMATHIWSILTHRESLWVKWVRTYKLKGHSFWDVPCRGDVSWGWRKLLQIRSTIRPFIWHKVNNGKSTSAWFDRWADLCPLKDMFSQIGFRCLDRGFSFNGLGHKFCNGVYGDGLFLTGIRFPKILPITCSHVLTMADIDDVISYGEIGDGCFVAAFYRWQVRGLRCRARANRLLIV
ncbi:hypothetical protein Tco_0963832, partial [Tanacetum coccineum]